MTYKHALATDVYSWEQLRPWLWWLREKSDH